WRRVMVREARLREGPARLAEIVVAPAPDLADDDRAAVLGGAAHVRGRPGQERAHGGVAALLEPVAELALATLAPAAHLAVRAERAVIAELHDAEGPRWPSVGPSVAQDAAVLRTCVRAPV